MSSKLTDFEFVDVKFRDIEEVILGFKPSTPHEHLLEIFASDQVDQILKELHSRFFESGKTIHKKKRGKQ